MIRFLVATLVLSVLGATACNNAPPVQTGGDVSQTYTAPSVYQDHRDQQQRLLLDDGRIAYTDTGAGDVIVLLHGVPTSSWMYRKVIPGLQENFRVITIDFLGFGSSDKPQETGALYSTTAHAARVKAVLAHLEVERFDLLMHDMGGLVAWQLLREDLASNANQIGNLIVLDTIVSETGFNHPDMEAGMLTRGIMDAYSSDLTSSLILEKTFSDLGLTGKFKLTEAECEGYVLPMEEGADSALYTFFTHVDGDLFAWLAANRTILSKFEGRTLVMWGAKDETLTVKQIPILQEMLHIPDENIHIYEDHAHFLAEEMPDEIVAQVRAFLN